MEKPVPDPVSPSGKPATLAEIRQAIDWFAFPKPPGAIWEKSDLLTTNFWVPGTTAQIADFYRKALAAQGWSEKRKTSPDPEPDKRQSFQFAKTGFRIGLDLTANKTHVQVLLAHHGNVDARGLPRPGDAKVTAAYSGYVSFTTPSAPELAAEFCRKEIPAAGWQEASAPGAKNYAKEGTTLLRFVQNAMECTVSIKRKGERETEVIYQTYCRSAFAPSDVVSKDIPKPATISEAVQMLDLRTLPRLGESEFKVNSGLRLEYETRASVARAAAFHREKLSELGWTVVPPLVDVEESGSLRFEKAGFLITLEIANLVEEANKAGLVSIALAHHGNVDLRQLPHLPGAEVRLAREDHVQYRTSAGADAAAEFYRKELARLGWQQKGRNLEFIQNDARLTIRIDRARDGETPVQVHGDFGAGH